MKKCFKLVSILIFFLVLNVNAEESYNKGDLRCPATLSSNAVSCTPKYNSAGKVDQIDITYLNKQGDKYIQIVKTVKKKDVLGEYDVSFFVKGNLDVVSTSGPTYIVVIFDVSSTMSDNISSATSALKTFARTLIPASDNGISNYYLAAIAFNNSTVGMKRNSFSNYNFDSGVKWPKYDEDNRQSYVNNALQWALNLFNNNKKNIPENANKYVFLFGDGNYWNDQSISKSAAGKALTASNNLRKAGVNVTGVLYNDGYTGSNAACSHYCGNNFGKMCTACCRGDKWNGHWIRNKQGECDKSAMKNLTGGNLPNGEVNYINAQSVKPKNWGTKLKEAAEKIQEATESTKAYIELTDQLGNEFFKWNDTGRYKNFELNAITEEGQTLGPFTIEIDEFADPEAAIKDGLEKYWHKTNSNFKFTYTSKSEGLKSFVVTDTPEVYWIPNKPVLDDCYATAQVDKVRSAEASDEYSFFSKICYEGGWNNLPGFKVTANVNSFTGTPNDSKITHNQFTLFKNSGYKFPASLNIEANLICTYNFKVADFNKRHDELNKDYKDTQTNIATLESKGSLTDEEKENLEILKKSEASLYIKLDDLNKILNRYKALINDVSDLEKYRNDFASQIATLKIDYDDPKVKDSSINFVNYGNVSSKLECTTGDSDKLYNNESIVYNKVCKLSLAKNMQLPNACLNMQTGEADNCKVDTPQIDGGNNFFINLLAKGGGKVFVTVPKAGYTNKLNFEMKNDKKGNGCYYIKDNPDNNLMSHIMFRPIDVADPFLKNYDRNRGVGKNYSNNTYDFEKIIHGDTWSDKSIAEYDYLLSKTNIENIRKNTSEDLKHSYLGRNCYFTSDNKYQCHFTRNENEDGSENGTWWYSNTSIKEGV